MFIARFFKMLRRSEDEVLFNRIVIIYMRNFCARYSGKREQREKYIRHFASLHETFFTAGPSSLQFFPPLDGGGLVQVLVIVFTPPPHVAPHFD